MNHRSILIALIQCSTLANISSATILRPYITDLRNHIRNIDVDIDTLNEKNVISPLTISRGGGGSLSTKTKPSNTNKRQTIETIQNYKLQQQHLLQLRSTFLSEALAARGINVGPTMVDVSTPEGAKPPKEVDWDCCLSTVDDPKTCLYSFDAEPNTKVICPAGTTQYISLSALNRLRRTDPSKVQPMWHDQYAILKSWFSDESEYSLLQFVGLKGFIVSTVLLDLGKGLAFKAALALSVLAVFMTFLPLIEVVMSRFLTSSFLWMKWQSWGKFVHAALPLKILIGQMVWNFVSGSFGKLESVVRDYVVDLECAILEDSIPVTIGGDVDSESDAEENGESDFSNDSEYDY